MIKGRVQCVYFISNKIAHKVTIDGITKTKFHFNLLVLFLSSKLIYVFYTMARQNVERNVLSRIQSGGSNLFYVDLKTIWNIFD